MSTLIKFASSSDTPFLNVMLHSEFDIMLRRSEPLDDFEPIILLDRDGEMGAIAAKNTYRKGWIFYVTQNPNVGEADRVTVVVVDSFDLIPVVQELAKNGLNLEKRNTRLEEE